VHSDMKVTGDFHCSDERVNRLFLNILWDKEGITLKCPLIVPKGMKGSAGLAMPRPSSAPLLTIWM